MIFKISKLNGGYSLLEVLITLFITGILIVMLSNIMLISIRTSLKIQERSFIREEVAKIERLIKKDIRNANSLQDDCMDSTLNRCTINHGTEVYRWERCNIDNICRYVRAQNSNDFTLNFQSNEKANIKTINFDLSGFNSQDDINPALIVTIVADHSNTQLEITNIYRQFIVSPRNYYL